MYELIEVTPRCHYIQSPAKIGLVKLSENEVILIDSGNDKDAGRKINQILDREQWSLKTIYNTHSNADHIGGNKFLQDRTGCEIYAPGIEADFTNHPILESSFIFGGYPPKALRHKFLLAQESKVLPLTEDKLPEGFEMIPLPGHFFDMTGFRTPDDVVYLADALSSKQTLDKYAIGFIYDVEAYLDTLEKIKTMDARIFIPSHAEPAEDMTELVQYNIDKVNEIAENIRNICKEALNFEKILQKLFCNYSLTLTTEQYALVGSTVRSYLTWLWDKDEIDCFTENNMMLWKTI